MIAIDVPYLGGADPVTSDRLPQGPDFPQDADDGFTFLKTRSQLGFTELGSSWEPDGTALADAKTYQFYEGTQNISSPDVTWTFDLDDDIVINAIYAAWTSAGTGRRTIWGYTEGASTDSYQQGSLPTSDLVLQWTDAASGTHNGNFQRIFNNSITVVGGDGFTLGATEAWNTGPIDAVILDYSPPTSNWTGLGDGSSWTDAANWDAVLASNKTINIGTGAPSVGGSVSFNGTGTVATVNVGTVAPSSLIIGESSELTVSAPSSAWRFLPGESPGRARPSQSPVSSVAPLA